MLSCVFVLVREKKLFYPFQSTQTHVQLFPLKTPKGKQQSINRVQQLQQYLAEVGDKSVFVLLEKVTN